LGEIQLVGVIWIVCIPIQSALAPTLTNIRCVGGHKITAVNDIHLKGQPQLPVVGQTLNRQSFCLGFGQHRQKHRGQDGNDGNNHEQFYERKRGAQPAG
jgi:hypothetical protein